MIPGKKVVAIFGFCDIHNFNKVNDVLQEVYNINIKNIMKFVNEIA